MCKRAGKRALLNSAPLKHPSFFFLCSFLLLLFSPWLLHFTFFSLLPAPHSLPGVSFVLPSVPHDHKYFINEWFWKRAQHKKIENLQAVWVKYCTAVNSVWFGWTTKRMSWDVEFPRKSSWLRGCTICVIKSLLLHTFHKHRCKLDYTLCWIGKET